MENCRGQPSNSDVDRCDHGGTAAAVPSPGQVDASGMAYRGLPHGVFSRAAGVLRSCGMVSQKKCGQQAGIGSFECSV